MTQTIAPTQALTDHPAAVGFTVPLTELTAALNALAIAVPTRAFTPALGGVLIRRNHDGVRLCTFDYETSVTTALDGQRGGEPAELLVSFQELRKVVKAATKGETARSTASWMVGLDGNGGEFSGADITVGGFTVPLGTLKASDYPSLPVPVEPVLTVDRDLLLTTLQRAAMAAGNDPTLPVLMGVHCELAGGSLTLACTDRFQLDVSVIPVASEATGHWLPPVVPLVALVKAMPGGPLHIGMTEGAWTLRDGPITATQRLLAEEFPRYRSLMRTQHACTVQLDRAALVKTVTKALAVSAAMADTTQYLQLDIGEDGVTVSPHFSDPAQQERVRGQVLPAQIEGDGMRVLFTGDYLLESLGTLTGPTVFMGLLTPTRPVLLADSAEQLVSDTASHRHLIMPSKLGLA